MFMAVVAGVAGLAAAHADARTLQPVQRCELAKLAAASVELRARVLCDRGRGSALDETPCAALAASRRAAAFTRAERGATCPALNDGARVGGNVESSTRGIRFSTVLRDDDAAKRCATRQLTAASRAVWDLSRAAIAHGRTGEDARFLAAAERVRMTFDATYARLGRSADCAGAEPIAATDLFDRITGAFDTVRGVTCPSCGAACPCWSTRELDASLPASLLDALGGPVCDENGTGVVSADRCTVPETGNEQPRAGVNVGGGLCVRWPHDADPDSDGACDTSPLVARVDRFSQASCVAALQASRLRQASCAPQSAARWIEPVGLPSGGYAASVGTREWIVVQDPLGVVLPWNASPSAGPLPVAGCPLGTDGACRVPIGTAAVGDTDWRVGWRSVGSSGTEFFALGPQGEVLELRPADAGDVLRWVRVGPGPLFFGQVQRGDRVLPVVWTTPDGACRELPAEGFVNGPSPRQSDAKQRIAGDVEEARLPVLWTRSGEGFRLETLPLLEGGTTGSATGIDADVVSGMSGSRAVAWELGGERIRVVELPTPREAVRCAGALGTSRGRVVGACELPDGRMVGVVWAGRGDSGEWSDVHVLPPFGGDDGALLDGFSGDLVIGRSVFFVQNGGVAKSAVWRLPPTSP